MPNVMLSKREYERQKEALVQEKERIEAEIKALEDKRRLSDVEMEQWTNLCDKLYELHGEQRDLESRWTTRKWTGAEWASYELVMQNID